MKRTLRLMAALLIITLLGAPLLWNTRTVDAAEMTAQDYAAQKPLVCDITMEKGMPVPASSLIFDPPLPENAKVTAIDAPTDQVGRDLDGKVTVTFETASGSETLDLPFRYEVKESLLVRINLRIRAMEPEALAALPNATRQGTVKFETISTGKIVSSFSKPLSKFTIPGQTDFDLASKQPLYKDGVIDRHIVTNKADFDAGKAATKLYRLLPGERLIHNDPTRSQLRISFEIPLPPAGTPIDAIADSDIIFNYSMSNPQLVVEGPYNQTYQFESTLSQFLNTRVATTWYDNVTPAARPKIALNFSDDVSSAFSRQNEQVIYDNRFFRFNSDAGKQDIDRIRFSNLKVTKDNADQFALTVAGTTEGRTDNYHYAIAGDRIHGWSAVFHRLPEGGTIAVGLNAALTPANAKDAVINSEDIDSNEAAYAFTKVPDTTTPGTKAAEVTVTYPDGHTEAVAVQVQVNDHPEPTPEETTVPESTPTTTESTTNDADTHDPIGEDIVVTPGDDPKPEDGISNKDDLPQGTTYAFKEPVTTDRPGLYDVTIVVTYPDGSQDEVPTHLIVREPAAPAFQAPSVWWTSKGKPLNVHVTAPTTAAKTQTTTPPQVQAQVQAGQTTTSLPATGDATAKLWGLGFATAALGILALKLRRKH